MIKNKSKKEVLETLSFHIEKYGFEVLEVYNRKELVRPLIYKDWLGTGGKLGYEPLAKKYSLSIQQIKTICSKFIKPVRN